MQHPGHGVTRGCRKWFLFIPLLLLPLIFSEIQVQKFHESPKMVDGSKHPVKKFDHLVFGPAAGQGFPGRVQCDGFKAISKIPSLHSSRFLKFQERVSIVTFFVTYNNTLSRKNKTDKFSERVIVGNTSYDKAGRSLAILNVFINFIQNLAGINAPKHVIILTDPASDLSYDRNNVFVFPIHGNYSRENLMLQRIKAYIAFLGAKLDEIDGQKHISHFVFTDSDVAIVDDLRCIFEKYPQFHLALTFRNNRNQPLNSGVIAVRGTREGILKAKTFLEEVLRIYVSKFSKASYMLGDQLSLAWVVKDYPAFNFKRFTKSEAFVDEINGAFVLFLPCLVYNWTPPEGAGQFHGMPVDVKGSRKRLMLESWNFFNSSSPNDFSDMMCFILESGRTKYAFLDYVIGTSDSDVDLFLIQDSCGSTNLTEQQENTIRIVGHLYVHLISAIAQDNLQSLAFPGRGIKHTLSVLQVEKVPAVLPTTTETARKHDANCGPLVCSSPFCHCQDNLQFLAFPGRGIKHTLSVCSKLKKLFH